MLSYNRVVLANTKMTARTAVEGNIDFDCTGSTFEFVLVLLSMLVLQN